MGVAGPVALVVVLIVLVYAVRHGRRQQYRMPLNEQYRRIRQDKEDGMRVNIKPEQR